MIRTSICLSVSFLLLVPASETLFGLGQDSVDQDSVSAAPVGGPLTGPPVLDAPFSAEATTTVKAHLRGGVKLDQTTTMRLFRDRAGRVRVEQYMEALEPAKTVSERAIRTIVDPDPEDPWVYGLDPVTRTARRMARSIVALTAGGRQGFAVPMGGVRFLDFRRALDATFWELPGTAATESLGPRQIEGVATIGRRGAVVLSGIKLVDERWESPELRLTIRATNTDPKIGTITYELKRIERTEPAAELFELPSDFTLFATMRSDDPWVIISRP